MASAITVKNLTKIFGSTVAVDDVSFEVKENEIFGLLGPNGSGKTTTQRMLACILEPTEGRIEYFGRFYSESRQNKIREKIGYVPQGDCLYGDLTIEENLNIFSRPYNISRAKRKKNIEVLMERLEIKDRRKTLVKNLSGGFAKRVSIATALVHEPTIVFLDEITMGLDPNSRYHIWELVRSLRKDSTIVMTTHYMDEAEELCDRVAILSKGVILELGTPDNIINKFHVDNFNQLMGKIIEKEK